jgi:hypothetical protein
MEYDASKPTGSQFPITEWRSIDLTDPNSLSDRCCQHVNQKTNKPCGHGAKIFLPDGSCYCGVHNPDKEKYKPVKTTGAKTSSLSYEAIGNALMDRLDEYAELWRTCDHVVLETQFTKNRRMIFLSAIIFGYFIKCGQREADSKISKVKFVSSRNKLEVYDGPAVTVAKRKNPKDVRKLTAIKHCEYMISGDEKMLQYFHRFPKKKDDLSDCFLQGAWYLKNECKATKTRAKVVAVKSTGAKVPRKKVNATDACV